MSWILYLIFAELYFGSGIGSKLQNHDSQIMYEILKKCFEKRIPALPIHDSVIVAKKYKDVVSGFMKDCYMDYCQKTFGFTNDIKIGEK
jgi:hypothetical protein